MIAVTTASTIEGYQVVTYKGTAQGITLQEVERHAESLGVNAILHTCYDNALDANTLLHGPGVVIEPIPAPQTYLLTEGEPAAAFLSRTEAGGRAK